MPEGAPRHGLDTREVQTFKGTGADTPTQTFTFAYMHASSIDTITVTLTLTVHSTRTSVRSILARTVLLLLFSRSPSPEITLPCGTRAVVALALRITYI